MIRVKMEEEEDTTPKKRGRKRKPRNVSPDVNSSLYSDGDSNESEEKKKKRGRKKKKKDVPPSNTADEDFTDFQRVYMIIQQMMTTTGAAAFMERPDDSTFGMSDYYEQITTPMWLKEIERKYKDEVYKTVTEMAMDVRLMLTNCYDYWGPCDVLSKRALKLEQLFENKLATLPDELKTLCSLETTHSDIVKEEPDEAVQKRIFNNKKGYISKLLCWVVNGKGKSDSEMETAALKQEAVAKARRAERAEAEEGLTLWENEHLLTDGVTEQIASMWEFPVIGQFLHLVYNVLNIDPISHLELERMLLMPQASNTLATLITSMLIPPLFRAKLEVGPAMPYSIWTSRLCTKVASWYRSYHSKGDSTVEVQKPLSHKVFDSLGIEPQFWLIMGEENPLEEYQFHELPLLQRVWLLKGLCDFIMHNHKTVQDCIDNLQMEELREMNLGRDKEGYSYHYFPMFTEVRIYKMAKVPDTKWKDYEAGVEEAITMCAEEEDDDDPSLEQNLIGFARRPHHKPPRSMRPSHKNFKLVCQSLDDVRSLIKEFTKDLPEDAPSDKLVTNLKNIVSDLESRESKLDTAVFHVRSRMRNEWNNFKNRSEHYIDPGVAYWERKEKEEKAVEEKPSVVDLGIPSTSADSLLAEDGKRERRTRRESTFKMLTREENGGGSDESEEESPLDFDDNSEDEWFASKRDKENKKKKRCMSAKKLKKMADTSEKKILTHGKEMDSRNPGPNIIYNKSLKPVGTSSLLQEPPVKIKQELPDPDDPISHSKPFIPNKPKLSTQHSKNHIPVETPKEQKKVVPIVLKQEILEEPPAPPPSSNQTSVIQTLVPPVKTPNVKSEKLHKPPTIIPDLSKVKRSKSPDDVVYISDSEDPPDIKPSPALLVRQFNPNKEMETINYSMNSSQPSVGNYFAQNPSQAPNPNQSQFVPLNMNQDNTVYNPQSQMYNMAQPPTQPITYQMPTPQPIVQQPNQTMVRMQGPPSRQTLAPNQKFMVIQPNANNVNKSQRAQNNNFPTTPTMQSVNWFGNTRGSPRGNTNYSPRQRGSPIVVQSPRGRGGSPRAPVTPTRGVQRFSGRTPPNNVRTPTAVIRTPSQIGARTPSPMRGRSPATPVRPGPVRNLNFNRSPAKPISKPANDIAPVNDMPDIEGTLHVSLLDNGGFGYIVLLPDGGKINLTSDQLAKIRSDNGGTLPKTCKVPLNMNSDVFRID